MANPAGTETVIIAPPTPIISGLNPNSATVGGGPLTLTVNGPGLLVSSVVQRNGSVSSTNSVSGTQLTASAPANLVANVGGASVAVPGPRGTASNPLTYSIASSVGVSVIDYCPPGRASANYPTSQGPGGASRPACARTVATPWGHFVVPPCPGMRRRAIIVSSQGEPGPGPGVVTSHRLETSQSGPPTMRKSCTLYAVIISLFRVIPVAASLPLDSIRNAKRKSRSVLGLIDATSYCGGSTPDCP
jgi:hypothetical protein